MISPNFPESYYKFAVELKARGFNVLGLGDAFINELSLPLKEALTEYVQCYNMKDINNVINQIQYLINKYGPIDYLESNNEYWLEEDSTLRQWFNIKTGIFHSEIMKYKAKSCMKEYFKRAGAPVAKFHLSDNYESTKEFAHEVGYPIFVKPNIGVGACGTKKIQNDKELQDFCNIIAFEKREYIFEQYLEGSIYSFDGIANSKNEIVFCNSEAFLVLNDEIVNDNSDDAYFTYDKVPEDIFLLGSKIVKAFDIKCRCFHIEFFRLSKDIPGLANKGELVALEVNMRPAGGFTPDMISYSQNVSFYAVYADMIAFDENRQDLNKEKKFVISVSRRDKNVYINSDQIIKDKYKKEILQTGRFAKAIADDMGDSYYIASFNTEKEARIFEKFVRNK